MNGDQAKYAAFATRIVRALARRCAESDPEDLTVLIALHGEVDKALTTAIAGLRQQGHSWTTIAYATGTTRQAARQRYADKIKLSDDHL